MSYSATEGDRRVGPVQIYGKAYTAPAADEDWNSVSGFTELFELDPETPGNVNFVEEFIKRTSAAHIAAIGADLVGQSLELRCTAKVVNLYSLAYAFGLTSASITDKTSDDPTRIQMGVGGHRVTNWWRLIIRQKHASLASKYVGYQLIKCHIRPDGPIPVGIKEHQEIPIVIEAVVLTSGDHADVLYYPYEEYGAAGPAISGILPASQSVGNAVTISGSGFGASEGASVVTFNSGKVATTILHWSDTSITCVIPADATTGNVTVTVGGVASAGVAYTIT